MVLCSAMLMQDEAQWENLQPPYGKKISSDILLI